MARIGVDLTELAWAAGFFDGEGCVGCYATVNGDGYRSPRLTVQISQVEPEPLHRFAAAIGVGRVTGPYVPKTAKSRPYYCYRTENFEKVQHIMASLWPRLSSPKRRDAHSAFGRYLSWANSPTCHRGHPMTRDGARRFCSTCRSEAGAKGGAAERERRAS